LTILHGDHFYFYPYIEAYSVYRQFRTQTVKICNILHIFTNYNIAETTYCKMGDNVHLPLDARSTDQRTCIVCQGCIHRQDRFTNMLNSVCGHCVWHLMPRDMDKRVCRVCTTTDPTMLKNRNTCSRCKNTVCDADSSHSCSQTCSNCKETLCGVCQITENAEFIFIRSNLCIYCNAFMSFGKV
jgi:hypothetical protein